MPEKGWRELSKKGSIIQEIKTEFISNKDGIKGRANRTASQSVSWCTLLYPSAAEAVAVDEDPINKCPYFAV